MIFLEVLVHKRVMYSMDGAVAEVSRLEGGGANEVMTAGNTTRVATWESHGSYEVKI